MPKNNDVLSAVLMDVSIQGAAVIDKRKLLWLMGKSHDRPTAWAMLLDQWEDIGKDRNDLIGCEVNGNIVLMLNCGTEVEAVEKWAGG